MLNFIRSVNQEKLQQILKAYWGYDQLRGMQPAVVKAVLAGKDVLAVMPTGGGKSLCFQLPAMMREGLCLVVSPLIALMQDQVDRLQSLGIAAAVLHSGLNSREISELYEDILEGQYQFLYVSAERLDSSSFLDIIQSIPLQLLVVDEAHSIAEWGYDFRPAYLKIGDFRQQVADVPCIALTASATPVVQKDIVRNLRLKSPALLIQDFYRPGLSYQVVECIDTQDKESQLLELLSGVKEGSALIYARSRKATEELSYKLKNAGLLCDYYHAGLSMEARVQKQQAWLRGETITMVCTSAFGMGIDKPDVRLVIHFGPTENIESYYQQAGRAGRDGQSAEAYMLYTPSDLQQLEKLPGLLYPNFDTILKLYQDIADYFQLPVGLGEDRFFSFKLPEFAERFGWNSLQVHSILKALEGAGLITYLEQVFWPAKVKVEATRAQIEAYAQTSPQEAAILEHLMRNYPNIFIEPVTIKTARMAWQLYMDESSVQKGLTLLHTAGYIEYLPARHLPQVHFLTGRAPAGYLLFDHESYSKRKKWFIWRLDMLLRYIRRQDLCRSEMLASYFGQEQAKLCGICDNCRSAAAQHIDLARLSPKT